MARRETKLAIVARVWRCLQTGKHLPKRLRWLRSVLHVCAYVCLKIKFSFQKFVFDFEYVSSDNIHKQKTLYKDIITKKFALKNLNIYNTTFTFTLIKLATQRNLLSRFETICSHCVSRIVTCTFSFSNKTLTKDSFKGIYGHLIKRARRNLSLATTFFWWVSPLVFSQINF